MTRILVILLLLTYCLIFHTKLTASEIPSEDNSSSSVQSQPSSTIVKAFYKSGYSSLQPIDIKVVVSGKKLTIVELKNPKTNIWTTTNCICQPIISGDMSKDFNYEAYHQIYGHIYFVGSGLSVGTSSSDNSFAIYKPVNSPRPTNSINKTPVVKSRMQIVNEQSRAENCNSSSKIENGYYQLDDNKWQVIYLEINYTSVGAKLVRYRLQDSNDWITVSCICSKIPSKSPLTEEFTYYVIIQGLGKIYF